MLEAVRRIGRPRLVGGGVRDWLLGLEAKDFDVEVAGADFETLQRALAPFGATDVVGRSFGVIKVRSAASGAEYDFSLPRRESKTGAGHRGFAVAPDPQLSDADAAARRDFTINAIACDPFTGELIDPHHGQRDLGARVLRHTSAAFVEDPLRVLRAFQLAARFDLQLAPETAALCRTIADTYGELPVERVWAEWEKWATKAAKPSRGLDVLEQTDWLRHFPEVARLRGTPQEPAWHPEGDVFTHTQHCVDALAANAEWQSSDPARRRLLMLAVLAHDFGKPSTTVRGEKRGAIRWISPGHEPAGGPIAKEFLRRIGAPLELDPPVCALVVHHLVHHHGAGGEDNYSDSQVRRLARKLAPATIDDLALVMIADSNGRPPLESPETIALIGELRAKAQALALERAAPKPLVGGRHLIALGYAPSPAFKPVLDAAFEAQLDGAFADEAGGLDWLRRRLQETGGELQ
ncbi:Polynucleotide adenylyltransferase region [Opitutus terrae PB90-1]|uniref:Polynucleotide adenylyltransferase region n=2 Tax=Opitutus terrae TaxID=107709 RepID=B1ZUE5_OPITP|nr:Polynucleotide adenylyltransferase region [Opitutus terrae PB90-1]